MTAKKQLAQAVEEIPDSVSLEEAFERLYRLFKLSREPFPVIEVDSWPRDLSLKREDMYGDEGR